VDNPGSRIEQNSLSSFNSGSLDEEIELQHGVDIPNINMSCNNLLTKKGKGVIEANQSEID
jgi:hypothetical protein